MSRLEKTYQTELKRSFDFYLRSNNKKGIWYKIPDTGYTKNPYDSWCLVDGNFYAMEQKINKAKTTFNFKTFFRGREHEITSLRKTEAAGGTAYVTINHYEPRKLNKVYFIPLWIAERAFDKGSVKLEQLLEFKEVIEVPRIKNNFNEYVWDLSVIFNNGL